MRIAIPSTGGPLRADFAVRGRDIRQLAQLKVHAQSRSVGPRVAANTWRGPPTASPATRFAGGRAFAGGLKMGTPLGAIYSTNITPDPETGIGRYSLADFDLAVRQGIAKDGRRLYPAMPYPSYVKLTDADVAALYGFFMKQVPPVHQANLKSEIPALLSIRWPLAFWNFFFAPSGSYVAKPGHDAAWNRGAYLVQGPGHCGACHTPRGIGYAGKGARRQQPELSRRSGARRLVRAEPARRHADRSRYLVGRRTSASFSSMATTASALCLDR